MAHVSRTRGWLISHLSGVFKGVFEVVFETGTGAQAD